MSKRIVLSFARYFLAVALFALAGCAFNPSVIDHSFSFDARWDSPDVDVLNYRYGNSMIAAARTQDYQLKAGTPTNSTNISGEMLRGDFLYVKWRIKSTGQVFEDTVDLRDLLPANIKGHRIHFIIKGPQLYVFLISADRLEKNPCPSRDELRRLGDSDLPFDKVFSMYCYKEITTLYPNQSKR